MVPRIVRFAFAIEIMTVGLCNSSFIVQKQSIASGSASAQLWKGQGIEAFDNQLFPKGGKSIPSTKSGVKIVLPDFDVMFSRIAEISPLAKQVLEGEAKLGFEHVEEGDECFKWRQVEKHKKRTVFSIEKIDNFRGIHTPLLRFRSHMRGPSQSRGERFSHLLTDREARKRWDMNLADIYVIYPISDMSDADEAMGSRFGATTRFGIGYCQTKQNIVSPREQLMLCGLQEFESGASLVWGVEMEDDQNHIFPGEKRLIRSRSHIYSTTLIPTGDETFDCEYLLQLEIGNFPGWLASPVLVETVKGLFRYADQYFEGGLGDGELAQYLAEQREKQDDVMDDRQSLLMTP